MSVKITIGESKTREKPFPKLMKGKNNEIVYFYESKVGFPLDGKGYDVINDRFHLSWNMSGFTDFNEPITLQNS
jgi:hypothetical protein